jgi:hypothetical protein
MRLSAILLSVLPVIHAQVIQGGWTTFGDSYAAGIGAGGKHASDSGKCRRRVNAYPSQLQADGSLAAGMNVEFSFQACSSAKIPDVVGQIATFRDGPESLRGFATISIGGNDAGFSDIIEACLVRAKFGSPSCDSVLASATETVNSDAMRQNLEDAYRAVLDAAKAPGKLITSFRLVVTGIIAAWLAGELVLMPPRLPPLLQRRDDRLQRSPHELLGIRRAQQAVSHRGAQKSA